MGNSKSKRKPVVFGAPSSASVAGSAMLRSLQRDSDAQFHLTSRFLTLHDLARLYGCCRSWHEWVARPRHRPDRKQQQGGSSGGHLMRLSVRALLKMQQQALPCEWTRALVTDLDVQARTLADENLLRSQARLVLRGVSDPLRFSGLRSLSLVVVAPPDLSTMYQDALGGGGGALHAAAGPLNEAKEDIAACFRALQSNGGLTSLTLSPLGPRPALALDPWFMMLFLLAESLESLEVPEVDVHPDQVGFGQLPLLGRLTRFSFGRFSAFRCGQTQRLYLAQCRNLTWIDCGLWTANPYVGAGVDDIAAVAERAVEQIDAAAALKEANGLHAAADSSSSSSASSSSSSFLVSRGCLTHLHLETTMVCSAVWRHLSRIVTLRELRPMYWRGDLTDEQWLLLAGFKDLRSFRLSPLRRDHLAQDAPPILAENFLPPLLRCATLQTLELASLRLSALQLRDIVVQLPELHTLQFRKMSLESVESLSSVSVAKSLESLSLLQCVSPEDGEFTQYRSALPSLPNLTRLHIEDFESAMLTPQLVEPLNRALLQRMPKLTLAAFTQNLRT